MLRRGTILERVQSRRQPLAPVRPLPLAQKAGLACGSLAARARGSRCRVRSSDNLGELNRFLEVPDQPDAYGGYRVTALSDPGLYLDGGPQAASLILLLILLAIAFERILGLDKVVNNAIRAWKEQRQYAQRNETIEARQKLENQFRDDADDPPRPDR